MDAVAAELGDDLRHFARARARRATACRGGARLSFESNCAKLSRWLEMEMPAMRLASIFFVSCFSALVAAPVQSDDLLLEPAGLGVGQRNGGAALGHDAAARVEGDGLRGRGR